MDEQAISAINEAEATVYSKYLDIHFAKQEFENAKSDALYAGTLGVMLVASAVIFENVDTSGRYDFGLLQMMEGMYMGTGIALTAVAIASLAKSVKPHKRIHS